MGHDLVVYTHLHKIFSTKFPSITSFYTSLRFDRVERPHDDSYKDI